MLALYRPTYSDTNLNRDSNPSGNLEDTKPDDTESVRDSGELTEDQALSLLRQPEVTAQILSHISKSPAAAKSRKANLALVMHPRTPRHISIPALRRLFTFDLMQVTLTPTVAADIRRIAEDQIMNRLESLSTGERMSLARRASGRVAAALLHDADSRVLAAALDNPRLVEASVVTALMKHGAPESLFVSSSGHLKWTQRREVQIALLRSEKTPLERAKKLAENFSQELLCEILPEARKKISEETSQRADISENCH
jgi:hypothetical protein